VVLLEELDWVRVVARSCGGSGGGGGGGGRRYGGATGGCKERTATNKGKQRQQVSGERDKRRTPHTALVMEVRLSGAAALREGADVGEDDNRGAVVVNAAVAGRRLLAGGREMGVLAAAAAGACVRGG
jgi:hypothetical protein